MLKKRIRKGIPEALRGRVWCHLAGSTQMLINNPGVYHDFLQFKSAPCEETIARDIGRTFPKHYLFNERSSLGQCALMNVLRAYSLHDPEVGYCQGMGFLSAMFLSYMPEEQSFWHLVACLNHKRYDLANLYRPRMPKVPELIFVFEKLMHQLMPLVAKHLEAEGLHPTMYLTQWFITLFTYNFPFEFVTRVWDMFLYEGWKVIFRVALALLKVSQSESSDGDRSLAAVVVLATSIARLDVAVLTCECSVCVLATETLLAIKFEGIMEFFRELPNKVRECQLQSQVCDLNLTMRLCVCVGRDRGSARCGVQAPAQARADRALARAVPAVDRIHSDPQQEVATSSNIHKHRLDT